MWWNKQNEIEIKIIKKPADKIHRCKGCFFDEDGKCSELVRNYPTKICKEGFIWVLKEDTKN